MRIRRVNQLSSEVYVAATEKVKTKQAKAVKAEVLKTAGGGFLKTIMENPNLAIQLMVIILTMSSESMQMERRLDGVATTVEKVKNVADVLTNTLSSVKAAAQTPRKIRQLLSQ